MIKIVSLIVFAVVLILLVVCRPEWLLDNTFLEGFITFEILSLLAIILTVTLPAVASIHLAINSIVAKHSSGKANLINIAKDLKSEVKSNAWALFNAFLLAIVVLFVKGLSKDYELVTAICNAAMLWILLLYLLCIFDIYNVIYGVADTELSLDSESITKQKSKKAKSKKR